MDFLSCVRGTRAIATLRLTPRAWPCLGPEEERERHSPFLLQKNKTFSVALRSGCRAAWMTADVPHFIPCFASPPHLRGTLGLSTRPHRSRTSSSLALSTAGIVSEAAELHRACVLSCVRVRASAHWLREPEAGSSRKHLLPHA